jgi:hypothetical protein
MRRWPTQTVVWDAELRWQVPSFELKPFEGYSRVEWDEEPLTLLRYRMVVPRDTVDMVCEATSLWIFDAIPQEIRLLRLWDGHRLIFEVGSQRDGVGRSVSAGETLMAMAWTEGREAMAVSLRPHVADATSLLAEVVSRRPSDDARGPPRLVVDTRPCED